MYHNLIEQNISGVKLEKLRQDAIKKTKIQRRIFPICMVLFTVLVIGKKLPLVIYVLGSGEEDSAALGIVFTSIRDLMMAAILSAVIYVFYMMLVWQKAYNVFNFSFKNKYVLDTIRQRICRKESQRPEVFAGHSL